MIKIANSLHFLIAQTFLFCVHCGAIYTLSPDIRVAIFPDKHISFRSITFITTILVESFMTGYTPFWLKLKPKTLLFKSIFTLIKKNITDLAVENDEIFLTRLISCYYFGFTGLLSLLSLNVL